MKSLSQKKKGFQAPVREWKHGEFGKRYLPMLSSFAKQTGIFDSDAINKLANQKNDRLYFSPVNFMLWHSVFIENVNQLPLPAFESTGVLE